MVIRYLIYLARWQLSTLILWPCIHYLAGYGAFVSAVAANLIGGLAFFWIDRLIFADDARARVLKKLRR